MITQDHSVDLGDYKMLNNDQLSLLRKIDSLEKISEINLSFDQFVDQARNTVRSELATQLNELQRMVKQKEMEFEALIDLQSSQLKTVQGLEVETLLKRQTVEFTACLENANAATRRSRMPGGRKKPAEQIVIEELQAIVAQDQATQLIQKHSMENTSLKQGHITRNDLLLHDQSSKRKHFLIALAREEMRLRGELEQRAQWRLQKALDQANEQKSLLVRELQSADAASAINISHLSDNMQAVVYSHAFEAALPSSTTPHTPATPAATAPQYQPGSDITHSPPTFAHVRSLSMIQSPMNQSQDPARVQGGQLPYLSRDAASTPRSASILTTTLPTPSAISEHKQVIDRLYSMATESQLALKKCDYDHAMWSTKRREEEAILEAKRLADQKATAAFCQARDVSRSKEFSDLVRKGTEEAESRAFVRAQEELSRGTATPLAPCQPPPSSALIRISRIVDPNASTTQAPSELASTTAAPKNETSSSGSKGASPVCSMTSSSREPISDETISSKSDEREMPRPRKQRSTNVSFDSSPSSASHTCPSSTASTSKSSQPSSARGFGVALGQITSGIMIDPGPIVASPKSKSRKSKSKSKGTTTDVLSPGSPRDADWTRQEQLLGLGQANSYGVLFGHDGPSWYDQTVTLTKNAKGELPDSAPKPWTSSIPIDWPLCFARLSALADLSSELDRIQANDEYFDAAELFVSSTDFSRGSMGTGFARDDTSASVDSDPSDVVNDQRLAMELRMLRGWSQMELNPAAEDTEELEFGLHRLLGTHKDSIRLKGLHAVVAENRPRLQALREAFINGILPHFVLSQDYAVCWEAGIITSGCSPHKNIIMASHEWLEQFKKVIHEFPVPLHLVLYVPMKTEEEYADQGTQTQASLISVYSNVSMSTKYDTSRGIDSYIDRKISQSAICNGVAAGKEKMLMVQCTTASRSQLCDQLVCIKPINPDAAPEADTFKRYALLAFPPSNVNMKLLFATLRSLN